MHIDPTIDGLSLVADCLDRAGLDWMLVGSVAAFLYGRERSTHDIDVVFDPAGVIPEDVSASLQPEYMLDPDMLADSLVTGMMANAIGLQGGPKIDLVPRPNDPFDVHAFERRSPREWFGRSLLVIASPDLVISKLRWAKDSLSERQLADVRAIMALGRFDEHDAEFNGWIDRLQLRDVLDASRENRYEA